MSKLLDLKSQATKLRARHADEVSQIQQDENYSPEAKKRLITELKDKNNEKMANLKKSFIASKGERISEIERETFSLGHKISATESDKILAQTSYRDAISKVSNIKNLNDLRNALGNAQKLDDRILAKAIGFVASERGWYDLANSALGSEHSDNLNELNALKNPTNQEKFTDNVHFTAFS